MNRFLIISILFFSIISSAYSQESISDVNRLSNIISTDSLTGRIMNTITSEIIRNAKMQIQGAGAKEKLDTYVKFINKESNELSKTYTNSVIPQIYSEHFTPNEIKDLIVFYETPTGKKLLLEMNEITKAMMTALYKNYLPDFQQKIKKELQRLDSKIWREAYRVKPEQVTVYEGNFSRVKKVIRIKNNTKTKETFITFAVPIYENKFWIRFDKDTKIIDNDSNESYLALKLENNLVLNKTMIVSDQKGKMIEVTLVFPLLKKSVEVIDIGENVSDDADLMSNNTAGFSDNANMRNIKVKDYIVE